MTCLPLSASYGVLTCGICKKFSCHKRQHMVIHLAGVHHLYKCPHCGKCIEGNERIEGDVAFRKHVTNTHKRRACLFCMTRTFENEEAYQSHKDAVHLPPMEYKWKCDACKKRLPTLERFIIHEFVQHGSYTCPHCIEKGIKKESDKENSTELTMYICKTGKKYWGHMYGVHDELVCLLCNMRTFKTQEDYNDHCEFCNACRKGKAIEAPCNYCKHPNKFRNKAEQTFMNCSMRFCCFFWNKQSAVTRVAFRFTKRLPIHMRKSNV